MKMVEANRRGLGRDGGGRVSVEGNPKTTGSGYKRAFDGSPRRGAAGP